MDEKDVNELIKIEFCGMNMQQMIYCQAVVFPAIARVIDEHADTILELGD